jgi:hypothetical protein
VVGFIVVEAKNRWHTVFVHVDGPRVDEFETRATVTLGIRE